MARQRKGKRATVVLDDETAQLLEAWRAQNCIGQTSRSRAVLCIVATYLGVAGWKSGCPGFGIAWDHSGPWKLKDPRVTESPSVTAARENVRLRLV